MNSGYTKLESRIRLVLAFDAPADLQEFITVCSISLDQSNFAAIFLFLLLLNKQSDCRRSSIYPIGHQLIVIGHGNELRIDL